MHGNEIDPLNRNERDLTEQLKRKSRVRRCALTRMAATAAAVRQGRNDLLPPLALIDIPLAELA